MTRLVRLGTRASALARWQTAFVRRALHQSQPELESVEVVLHTSGDHDVTTPLTAMTDPGVFTDALERALRANEIDIAVHSLKDAPIVDTRGLMFGAICFREDPRDVLVSRDGWTVATLPRAARVGTCSNRRGAQLLARRPDLTLAPLRGNVDTRVRQAEAGAFDAIVLAAAGLHRLGLMSKTMYYLSLEEMLPAPGQGALAVQCRSDDADLRAALARLDDPVARATTDAERGFLEGLGGGCSEPIAAHATGAAGTMSLRGVVASHDGQTVLRVETSGALNGGHTLGLQLAAHARARGAMALFT